MASGCEFEFMEYTDEDSIDPNLVCSICHKPLKDPVCTPCDHTYGRACITHWLTQNIKYSCPMCTKQPILIKDLTQANRPLRNMLDQLRVRCTLCEQTGLQRGNFVDHINKVCSKAMVKCQAADIECPWKGPREELHNHVSVCVFEPLRPVLATLIAENRQLIEQVGQHENKIKELTKQMSQLNETAAHNSDGESDILSVSEFSVGGNDQKEEDVIFIRNLPSTIRFNDIFDLFSKVGRIKYNKATQKPDVLIFQNRIKKDGLRNGRVVYVDKESAAAAVLEFNHRQVPQWNTRLLVNIWNSKRRNVNDSRKDNNENTGASDDTTATGGCAKIVDEDEKISSIGNQPQSLMEQNQESQKKNTRSRRPYHYRQGDKPTS